MHQFSVADSAMEILLEVGRQLDSDIFPSVFGGGIVLPSDATIPKTNWASKEPANEQQGQRRPETRTWSRASGGQRPPSQTAPTVGTDLKEQYEKELTAVLQAYPSTRVWHEKDGLWLLTESALLPGLQQKAVFLAGIPYARTRIARAWGFWSRIPMHNTVWIGPRHTNFGDGSICAFEPLDGTWAPGDSILELLDLYSLWALRQLHLQVIGRWPGRQVAHSYFERFLELRSDEFCGCGSNKLYADCCQVADLARDLVADAVDFYRQGGNSRTPPDGVVEVIRSHKNPPRISELLPSKQLRYRKNIFGFDRFFHPAQLFYGFP